MSIAKVMIPAFTGVLGVASADFFRKPRTSGIEEAAIGGGMKDDTAEEKKP